MITQKQIVVESSPEWVGKSQHDFCSPSKLDLRACCPGSAALERKTERTTLHSSSPAAERGKRLWDDLVDVLEGKCEIEPFLCELEPEDKVPCRWVYDRILEIIERAKSISPDCVVTYELQLDLSHLGISGGIHGSKADMHILLPGYGSIVVDVKLGVWWVNRPEYNRQFKAYASGTHRMFGGPVECIKLQPALSEEYQYMSCKFEDEHFEAIDNDIRLVVYNTRQENAPLIRGEHCQGKFCWLRNSVCPLYRQTMLEVPAGVDVGNYFTGLNSLERKEFYEKVVIGKTIFTKAEATIKLLAVENNVEIDGYEIGEGKKSYDWIDVVTAFKALVTLLEKLQEKGKCIDIKPSDFEIPATLLSVSNIKKLIGSSKMVQEALKELIIVTPGKPTLKKKRD